MQSMSPKGLKPTPSPPYPGLSFITFSDPNQSRHPRQRKAVRSHAASYQHQLDKASSANQALGTRKRAHRGKQLLIPLEVNGLAQFNQANGIVEHRSSSPIGILGEGRVDPFRTYPVPWEPFLPELIDHCKYSFISADEHMFYEPPIMDCKFYD
jgi:hypothetical protein